MKKIIYVAGPYTAESAWGIEQNVRKAEEIALRIIHHGYGVICPHTMCRFYEGVVSWNQAMEMDLELLRRCDGVFMVPGWEASNGAKAERAEALGRRIPIYYDFEDLPAA